jgi:hypothetical protein
MHLKFISVNVHWLDCDGRIFILLVLFWEHVPFELIPFQIVDLSLQVNDVGRIGCPFILCGRGETLSIDYIDAAMLFLYLLEFQCQCFFGEVASIVRFIEG